MFWCVVSHNIFTRLYFFDSPRARENTTQLVKTYRDKHLIRSIYRKRNAVFFYNMMRVLLTACSEGFNFIDDYLYIYIINFQDLEYYLSKGEQTWKKQSKVRVDSKTVLVPLA